MTVQQVQGGGLVWKSRTVSATLYGLCTMLFFYIQLRVALQAVAGVGTLTSLIISLFAIKLGEAVHEKVSGGGFMGWVVGVAAGAVALHAPPGPAAYAGYFVFALSAMKVRDTFFADLDRRVKIWSRALGFCLAPFGSALIYTAVILIIFALGAALSVQRHPAVAAARPFAFHTVTINENRPVYVTMFLHHFHYFAYAYSIPMVFALHHSLPPAWYGCTFYVGWSAYNAYQRYLKSSWRWFVLGHLLSAAALVGLYLTPGLNLFLTLFLWLMTGLGGGTVYMLSDLVAVRGSRATADLRIAEIYGHLAGLACWSLFVLQSPLLTFAASATVVGLLLIVALVVTHRGGDRRARV